MLDTQEGSATGKNDMATLFPGSSNRIPCAWGYFLLLVGECTIQV